VCAAVEREAAAHAEDRWWILEPALLDERGGLGPLPERLPRPPYAVALHVDLELDGEPVPAIVVSAMGRMATATLYARVERTEAGTPRLGEWVAAPELAGEVETALARNLPRP
jgi:hypothetical protein